MRFFFSLLVLSLALGAASCDSTELPPDPPPGPGPWTLGPCVEAPGVAALFIGGPDVTCVSEAGTFESTLTTLGRFGGSFYFHHRGGGQSLIVLATTSSRGVAHSFDLRTGAVERLSVEGTADSQITRAGDGRFLITDFISDPFDPAPSDTARFAFSFLEGDQARTTLRLEVPDIGYVGFRDADYEATTGTSAHLFVTTPGPVTRLLVVDHDTGTYRFEDISYAHFPTNVRYRPDGVLLLLDPVSGKIHSVTDGGAVVLDLDESQSGGAGRTLTEDRAGEIYTLNNGPDGTRVLRLTSGGGVEGVLTLDRPQRYMHVSASADVICLREFHPSEWDGPMYDDVVSIYDLDGTPRATHSVTLRGDDLYYEFPPFACF